MLSTNRVSSTKLVFKASETNSRKVTIDTKDTGIVRVNQDRGKLTIDLTQFKGFEIELVNNAETELLRESQNNRGASVESREIPTTNEAACVLGFSQEMTDTPTPQQAQNNSNNQDKGKRRCLPACCTYPCDLAYAIDQGEQEDDCQVM